MESFQFFLIKNISRRENSHSGLYIPQGISLQPCTHPVNKGFFRCRCGDTGATLEIPLGSVGLRYNEKHYRFFLKIGRAHV